MACYVHYPTISTDMLSRVYNRTPLYNNSNDIASSLPKSLVKLAYYYLFACAYGMAGGCAQVCFVISMQGSWSWPLSRHLPEGSAQEEASMHSTDHQMDPVQPPGSCQLLLSKQTTLTAC